MIRESARNEMRRLWREETLWHEATHEDPETVTTEDLVISHRFGLLGSPEYMSHVSGSNGAGVDGRVEFVQCRVD